MSMFRRLGMANFSARLVAGDLITITDQTISAFEIDLGGAASATTRYTLGANGGVVIQSTHGTVITPGSSSTIYNTLLDAAEWIDNKANAANYSFKWVLDGGSTTGFTIGGIAQNTWTALNVDRVFTLATGSTTTTVNRSITFTVSIALTSDTGTILDTAQISLSSQATGTAI